MNKQEIDSFIAYIDNKLENLRKISAPYSMITAYETMKLDLKNERRKLEDAERKRA